VRSKKDDSFREFVLDQLCGLEGVASRPLFGGHGLYQGRTFFGIIFKGNLYFKTCPSTQPLYRERGMKPFRPNQKQTLKNYYEVPADILEDPDQLHTWAASALSPGLTDQ
jgi:DNA transformation protein